MTDTSAANPINDLIRNIFTVFDRPAYWLLGLMYQIFFNVASADLFNNATILGFYKRVQLIIGVFMIFQLAVTILKGIMNPDEIFSAKSGIASIITRVILALVLLTVLVPISIPGAATEYERQINNNGLLFGTLYSLQHRILANNTLGRLVLGTTDGASSTSSNTGLSGADAQAESLERSSRIFSSTILKGFIRINLVPEEYRKHVEGKTDDMINDNRICKDIDDSVLNAYTKIDADPGEIISLINADCTPSGSEKWLNSDLEKTKESFLTKLFGKKRYAFAHMPFISAIVAFIFVFILVEFTVQIAVRAIKLAILRLIAPIPIISYMDPKGSKDTAFNSWVKALASTYIDIFIRLAMIYFVIYLIQDMIVNGIVMNTGSGMIGILSAILIWIGLFIFAREAPKFIRQVLGMKEDKGSGFLSGLGTVAGVGAAAVGAVGSGIAANRASYMADEANGKDHTALNRGKNIVAGITGGLAGFGTGVHAAVTSKDHQLKNTFDAMQKRNATAISRGASGSTALGRLGTNLYRMGVGESKYEQQTRELEREKQIASTGKQLKEYLEDRAIKRGGAYSVTGTLNNGTTFTTTLDEWRTQYEGAKQRGDQTFSIAGKIFNTFGGEASRIDGDLVTSAGQQWAVDEMRKGSNADRTLVNNLSSFRDAGGDKNDLIAKSTDPNAIFNSDVVKKVAASASDQVNKIENSAEYRKAKANFGATGGKK